MLLIDINEALQAVDNRIYELKAHEIFRNKGDEIDVLGVKKWINNITPIEAIPKDNVHNAIQEIMKYEHEGFIDISFARLDEILKRYGVIEDGKINGN